MEQEKKFRKLYASEIECRVATVSQPKVNSDKLSGGGCSILLYKDARVDMRLLDERFGIMGWKREHTTIDGRLYCTISVWDNDIKQWVSKQDVGVESYTEKEKGQASDSFKRAGFNWGIGRELYTAPFIWIVPNEKEWKRDTSGKYQPRINLEVETIEYYDDAICFLRLVDASGAERYRWGVESAILKASDEARQAKTIEELEVIYHAYENYKSERTFLNAVTKRKNQLAQMMKAA